VYHVRFQAMPRPRSLTLDQIGAAGLAVIDHDGLAGLTMRSVAHRLRVSTMALYRYVADRHELEALVLERALADLDTTPPADRDWTKRIQTMLLRVRDALAAHPEVIPLTMAHRQSSPSVLRWSETVARILDDAGLTGTDRVVALRGLSAYAVGALQLAYLGPLAGHGTAVIAALPKDGFPDMSGTARSAANVDPDTEFRGGLAILLAGLACRSDAGTSQ
jgi:AcrR family transcriptional regulator